MGCWITHAPRMHARNVLNFVTTFPRLMQNVGREMVLEKFVIKYVPDMALARLYEGDRICVLLRLYDTLRHPTMCPFMWQDAIGAVVCFVAECLNILQTAVAASHQP